MSAGPPSGVDSPLPPRGRRERRICGSLAGLGQERAAHRAEMASMDGWWRLDDVEVDVGVGVGAGFVVVVVVETDRCGIHDPPWCVFPL